MAVTGGVAAPMVVPMLSWGGTAVGIGGGATKIIGTLVCQHELKSAIEELVELIKEDAAANDALMRLEDIIQRCQCNILNLSNKYGPIVEDFMQRLGDAKNVQDLCRMICKELPPIESILKYVLSFDHNNEMVKLLLRVVTACGKNMLTTYPTTATSAPAAASTVACGVADDVAVVAVKKTAAGGARTAALATGGVMVGTGVAMVAWEIYQIVKKTKEKCKIAEELGEIAKKI